MHKIIKYAGLSFVVLLALLLALAGIVAATFDPNDYKPQLIRLVQEKMQRSLQIPGEIKLTFFPKIGADLGQVSLSERGSGNEFAAFESAKVSLALIPLLSKQVVVDQIRLDGLRANITRFQDGSTNLDDLLGADQTGQPEDAAPTQSVVLDIDSIDISNAQVVIDDRQQARRFELHKLDLETGKIAKGVPSKLQLAVDIKGSKPVLDVHLALNTGFTMDPGSKHYVLKDFDAELTGKQGGQPLEVQLDIPQLVLTDKQVSGGQASGTAKLVQGARTVEAAFSAAAFEGTPQAFTLPSLTLDATLKEDKLEAKIKLSGALSGDIDKLLFTSPDLALVLSGQQDKTALNGSLHTPLTANLKAKTIELAKLVADFTLPNPAGGTFALQAGGNASVNLDKKTASAALKGKLDQSSFDAKLGLAAFSPAAYTFDINIDKLDLDRYKRKQATSAAPVPATPAGEQPMEFGALQTLRANGSMRIGALKVANIKSTNVRVDLRAANGKLDLNPLAANLYGGSAAGALSISAGKPARFTVRQMLSNIHVGPLLQDAIDKAPIEGRGTVQLDVSTSGNLFDQIKKNLNGSARMELRDGAVRGVNVAQTVRQAKAKIDTLRGKEGSQEKSGTGSAAEKTDFSEMTASFRITNGVARNDDLNIKSPLIRVGGAGDINLGANRLDYLARATVVSTLQGQGGPELQALKGLTVPVKLSGPFDAIDWRIDFAGMASALAKQKLDEKKDELKEKAQKALGEEKGKLQDQIKDRLKGLLGK